MDYKNLLLAKENGIGIVTVNRPGVLNALNTETYQELYEMFTEIENDPEIRVVILTGAGEKAFAAGVDIRDMKDKDSVTINEFIVTARKAGDRIYKLSKPVIAAVNGFALGGGCEIAMSCDIRYASSNAKFGQPEINLGIIPGFGGTARLSRLVGLGIAKELVYGGEQIKCDEALRIGLVNKMFESVEELRNGAMQLARKLAAKPGVALALAKQSLNNSWEMPLNKNLKFEVDVFCKTFDTEDKDEGVSAFLGKREAKFKHK